MFTTSDVAKVRELGYLGAKINRYEMLLKQDYCRGRRHNFLATGFTTGLT